MGSSPALNILFKSIVVFIFRIRREGSLKFLSIIMFLKALLSKLKVSTHIPDCRFILFRNWLNMGFFLKKMPEIWLWTDANSLIDC